MFSKEEFDLGRTSLIYRRIDTGNAKLIHKRLWRHPQVYMEVINTAVAKMEATGIIEPYCSPWASNVVIVAKHDSTPSHNVGLSAAQQCDIQR